MKTKALLLAGGLGTRLRPLTETVPKCLIEVGGRPMLDYWTDALDRADIPNALVNTHHLPEPVRQYIADQNRKDGVKFTEAYEPNLLGSAGTVHHSRSWCDHADEIIVIYADNLSDIDLSDLLKFHRSHDDPMTMVLFQTTTPTLCGIAELDDRNRIIDFIEKPENPKSNLANAGVYVLDSEAWFEIADMNAFDFGFDVIPHFVGRMSGYAHIGYHRDIGTLESLEIAQMDCKKRTDSAP